MLSNPQNDNPICDPSEERLGGILILLKRVKFMNDGIAGQVHNFIKSPSIRDLAAEYAKNLLKRNPDIGFNLFELISEIYYRENFHSDIIKALLDPSGKHGEGAKFLEAFLLYIKSKGAQVDIINYRNAEVIREDGRIDILICDRKSKHAIIIENKINGAPDMKRQIPRYFEYVKILGFECDAIVYLRLNGEHGPDSTTWTPADHLLEMPSITNICAYNETTNDLLNGWIKTCESAASAHSDAQHILRQYGKIICKLGGNIMNQPIMEDFYKLICEDDNFKTALSLKAMVDDLVQFRVEKIITRFKNDLEPFRKLGNYNNYDACFTELVRQDAHFGMDVIASQKSYSILFWDRNDAVGVKGNARRLLEKMGCLEEYKFGGRFTKKVEFIFPSQESELIEYIANFKKKLAEALKNI